MNNQIELKTEAEMFAEVFHRRYRRLLALTLTTAVFFVLHIIGDWLAIYVATR